MEVNTPIATAQGSSILGASTQAGMARLTCEGDSKRKGNGVPKRGRAFEPVAMTVAEMRLAARTFGSALSNFRDLHAWWVPSTRHIAIRVTAPTTDRAWKRLPDDAIDLGRYVYPFPSREFVEDLDYILAGGR